MSYDPGRKFTEKDSEISPPSINFRFNKLRSFFTQTALSRNYFI